MKSIQANPLASLRLFGVLLCAALVMPDPALSATVALATSPLATSTTTSVKPNLLFVIDNSGSMAWDHMPDDNGDAGSSVVFNFGYYGVRSSQCNQVYYDPTITYITPINSDGVTSKSAASFSGAWNDGFAGGSTTDLRSSFTADQDGITSPSDSGQTAYYYNYSGTQTAPEQKRYHDSASTFFSECGLAQNSDTGEALFTKIVLTDAAATTTAKLTLGCSSCTSTSVSSIKIDGVQLMSGASTGNSSTTTAATNIAAKITLNGFSATASSGVVTITGVPDTAKSIVVTKASGNMYFAPTIYQKANATNKTNFANWYSYYRTRMLMMKTAAGNAFKNLNSNYRVGLMKISSTTPVEYVDTFEGTHRDNWYTSLRNMTTSGSTPLRTALSNAGRYYAHKLSGTDPIQYSCQQNFTILSTDGYWNSGDPIDIDGNAFSASDNQDGNVLTAPRPMYDGAITTGTSTVTITYTRNSYSCGGCTSSTNALRTQPQIGSCTVNVTGTPTGSESCNPSSWSNNGSRIDGACVSNSACDASIPAPNPSTKVESDRSVSTDTTGGSKTQFSLADIAMYYYQTDLRTSDLGNCTGTITGENVCTNNVFTSSSDNNIKQHMTTFTLGMGASGKMIYSSCYLSDTCANGQDFLAVKLGTKTNLAPSTITVTGSGSTTVSSIKVNGVELMSATSVANTSPAVVASNIAAKITLNGFSAAASGSTVSIAGPASALGFTPVITKSGTMALAAAVSTTAVCPWQTNGTVCNWPVPGMSGSDGLITNIDDLWHAAVDGRGAYFAATNPTSLSNGLSSALAGLNARRGSAAAAATSTLNPVAGNNYAYVASYTTVSWKGNLEARGINTETGIVSENASWCVENVTGGSCASPGIIVPDSSGDVTVYYCETPDSTICPDGILEGSTCKVQMATACTGTMNALVGATTDTRVINTANDAGNLLTPFNATYATAHSSNFSGKLSSLSHWGSLTSAQQTAATSTNLIGFLRGQYGYEDRTSNAADNRIYRFREAVLGDALESQPAYIGKPVFSYPYPGYSSYLTAQASRAGTVYMGANDGMMHAFNADTGGERWAYVPTMVIPNLWKLADKNYATLHANFVNGSPITSDVCVSGCGDAGTAVWKTILVGGLNGGGRGYYALDITNPATPVLLWEMTTTAGTGIIKDDDVGYSFGHPIITRKADGTWVVLVTSGYNNVSPGTGKGFLYVLNAGTGAIISKIATGVGSTATPSGLAKIAAWNNESAGNLAGYVYGGDLQGNVWRFDINSATTAAIGTGAAMKFALLEDASGNPQPITTTPTLGTIVGKRVVLIGTGKYLETGDLTTTQTQSIYAIKDDDATTTLVNPRTTLVQQTLASSADTPTRISTSSNGVDFYNGRGWFVDFPDSGERVNIDSKLVEGVLLVATTVPSNTACSPGGYGWLNFLDYLTGASVSTTTNLVSSKYDSPIVGINVLYIQGKPIVEVVTATNPTPKSDDKVEFKGSAPGFTGKRVTWRELISQ